MQPKVALLKLLLKCKCFVSKPEKRKRTLMVAVTKAFALSALAIALNTCCRVSGFL